MRDGDVVVGAVDLVDDWNTPKPCCQRDRKIDGMGTGVDEIHAMQSAQGLKPKNQIGSRSAHQGSALVRSHDPRDTECNIVATGPQALHDLIDMRVACLSQPNWLRRNQQNSHKTKPRNIAN